MCTIETSADIKELAAALLKFQGLVEGVKRDSANRHFGSKYASLEAVIDTARPALQEAGIAFTQAPGRIANNTIEMSTMLIHAASGQWMRSTMQIALGKQDPQGVGSATTYSARYSLMATLGLPPTDDDGEAAMDRNAKPANGNGNGRVSAYRARKDGRWEPLIAGLRACGTIEALKGWHDQHEEEIGELPEIWRDELREEYSSRYHEIRTR